MAADQLSVHVTPEHSTQPPWQDSEEFGVYHLSPQQVLAFYPLIWDQSERAYRHGAPHPTELIEQAVTGAIVLWAVIDFRGRKPEPIGLIATKRTKDAIWITAVSGRDMALWRDRALREMKDHAKLNGVTDIFAESRKGMGRALGISPIRATRFLYKMEAE